MFFVAAKLASFFLTLPNALVWTVVLGVAGLWTRWFRLFRALATLAAFALAVCAFTPLASALLRPLEDRFPRPVLTEPPTGIIVLGGVTDEALTHARDAVAFLDGAERLTEAVRLARLYPDARLVFSGGSGRFEAPPITEAAVASRFWTEMGVPADRVTLEDRSRNTWENAVFTKEVVRPKPGETWLLMTSAAHMPRSIGIFRRIDFPVTPYPVDFHTSGTKGDFVGTRNANGAFADLATASHEWIGLLAYRLTGKTDAFFPGP